MHLGNPVPEGNVPNVNRVELKMSRARIILVAVLPAMFLLVALEGYSDCGAGDNPPGFFSLAGGGQRGSPASDTSLPQAVRRCARRSHVTPGVQGFSSLDLAQAPNFQPGPRMPFFVLAYTRLELANGWQFLWRTALDPRAPSLVS